MESGPPNDEYTRPAALLEEPIAPAPTRPLFGVPVRAPSKISFIRKVIGVLAALLLLLGGALGWLGWSEVRKRAASQVETQPTTCTSGRHTYTSAQLGLEFCYPAAWGDVAVTDARFTTRDTGTRWRLSFSAMRQIHLGVVSADWATAVPRNALCADPAVQSIPSFASFSPSWEATGKPVVSAVRSIEVVARTHLLEERVDEQLGNGTCLSGYALLHGAYPHVVATYSGEFGGKVTTPDQHIATPDILIPTADRSDFAAFVKSIRQAED